MEEDIKMLKDRIEYHKLDPEEDNGRVSFMLEEIDQLENILNRLKQDERVIEEMAKYIEDTVEDDICNKENCYADRYINGHCKKCVNCIIDYFRKKCE